MKGKLLFIAGAVGLLAGCPDTSNNKSQNYTVTVKNVMANQPLSPLAVLSHNNQFSLFTVGESASTELEYLAEGGSNAELLALSSSSRNVHRSASGNGVIVPGGTDSVTIKVNPHRGGYLSVASMLVNTNDAFVAKNAFDIKSLSVGESYQMTMNVWDAGTEGNDESAATIPGPAGGGEGFNAARNDDDAVTFHPGVVSQDDGLIGSALSANHRFLNPGAVITITRNN
ncbi:spondin domain-containing protein [Vibrio sp. TRT 17S01]|uniref:spondin domain-containing protein n=1 Tax=Vibrio sp. TRT 17S01 TaxID=3418505 RepID=UPI003CF3F9BE